MAVWWQFLIPALCLEEQETEVSRQTDKEEVENGCQTR
jgi:hypothetical protein